jgi:hypothetical protein
MTDMKVLSIDAWRESEGGWAWNAWYSVGSIDKAEFEKLKTNRAILRWFRDSGYLGDGSKGCVTVDDDQFNVVVCARSSGEPLFAIEYGPHY